MRKDQRLPKNLSGSNWTLIGLEMWLETLIFYCRDSRAPNIGLLRSDLLLKCYEISSVALSLSYEPNVQTEFESDSEWA